MVRVSVIVLGLGGMGSAALYHLARRGHRVLGLEQFQVGHDRGSSHGDTRIIRRAYFEHPDYVPLVDRAFTHWFDLERHAGAMLFERTGLLLVGRADDPLLAGVTRAAEVHRFPLEHLSGDETRRRFTMFRPPSDAVGLFEPDAGFLRVERCVQSYTREAMRAGATVVPNTRVTDWSADVHGVRVHTAGETYEADRLVVCAGAWTSAILRDMGLPLSVRRKTVFWFAAEDDRYRLQRGCPVFAFQQNGAFFYGFPQLDDGGVKMAEHTGGTDHADADAVDRTVRPGEESRVADFAAEHLPGVARRVTRSTVCLYTMTPDEHFVVDTHPDTTRVCFAAGFSGHGFKFASVMGSVLADLAIEGATAEPVGFLRADRLRRPAAD